MKKLSLLFLVTLAGCDGDPQVQTTPEVSSEVASVSLRYSAARLMIVTNSGHRFAIVQTSSHDAVGICEVTDSSSIEKK